MPHLKSTSIFLLSIAWTLGMSQEPKSKFKPNTTDITQELQKVSKGDRFRLVWWIPDEFWIASSGEEKSQPILKALSDYTIIAAIDGKVSDLGSFAYRSESETRNSIKIFDSKENSYQPIDITKISGDAKNFLDMMKPILANAMGDMGNHFSFYVFPRKAKDGQPIVNTKTVGRFKIKIDDELFSYRTPIAAMSPNVKCKDDAELFPSNYKFCPFHGTELIPQ